MREYNKNSFFIVYPRAFVFGAHKERPRPTHFSSSSVHERRGQLLVPALD